MRIRHLLLTLAMWMLVSVSGLAQTREIPADVFRLNTGPCRFRSGSGSPEGAVTGNPCDTYVQTNVSGAMAIWSKTSGSATNTGWQALGGLGLANLWTTTQAVMSANASDVAVRSAVSGESYSRFYMTAAGIMWWGGGAATQDAALYRSGAATLSLTGSLLPSVNNTYNLGSSSYGWGSLYWGYGGRLFQSSANVLSYRADTTGASDGYLLFDQRNTAQAAVLMLAEDGGSAEYAIFRRWGSTHATAARRLDIATTGGGTIYLGSPTGIGATTASNTQLYAYRSGAKTATDYAVNVDHVATNASSAATKAALRLASTGSWNGTNIGLYVSTVSGGTSNYAIYDESGGAPSRLSGNLTVYGGTLYLGADTSIYRAGVDTLKTDDTFVVNELFAKAFTADLEQALAGGQIIGKSVAPLYSAFSCPVAGGTATLTVLDLPSMPNAAAFVASDWVVVRTMARSGGSLTIGDCVGQVTSYADGADGEQTWTFTRGTGGNAGSWTSGSIPAGSLAIDYGVSGNGYYEVSAIDGTWGANSPYAQIVTWTTSPVSANRAVRARFGNLNGQYGYSSATYGVAMGDSAATNVTIDPTNGFRIRSGTTNKLVADTSGNLSIVGDLSIGTSGTIRSGATAYDTDTGYWLAYNGGTPQLRIGTTTGAATPQYFRWTGSNVEIKQAKFTLDADGLRVNAASSALDLGGAFRIVDGSSTYLHIGSWNAGQAVIRGVDATSIVIGPQSPGTTGAGEDPIIYIESNKNITGEQAGIEVNGDDQLIELKAANVSLPWQRRVRYYRSAAYTLTTATPWAVSWDTKDASILPEYAWGAFTAVSASNIYPPFDGYYQITAQVGYATNSTGDRLVQITKNGTEIARTLHAGASASLATVIQATVTVYLTTSDYITVNAYQASGGNLGIDTGAGRTWLSFWKVG